MTVRPKRLAARSTISVAVRPRSSRNGFSSTRSSERDEAALVEQLHREVSLAHGRPTGHGGAHGGRDVRVEEVDVQRDVDARVGLGGTAHRAADQLAHAELVHLAHVVHGDAVALQQRALVRVDGADADHGDGSGDRAG